MLLALVCLLAFGQLATPMATPVWTIDRILSLGANLALVVALGLNAWQLHLMRRQLSDTRSATMMSRALEFCHRCNDLEFVRYRKPVYDLLETNPQLNDLLQRIDDDPEFKGAFRYVLNFYEEVGLAYNEGEVDEPTIRDFYSGQIEFLHRHASPYIQHMRATYGDGLWVNFTKMRDDLKNNQAE